MPYEDENNLDIWPDTEPDPEPSPNPEPDPEPDPAESTLTSDNVSEWALDKDDK